VALRDCICHRILPAAHTPCHRPLPSQELQSGQAAPAQPQVRAFDALLQDTLAATSLFEHQVRAGVACATAVSGVSPRCASQCNHAAALAPGQPAVKNTCVARSIHPPPPAPSRPRRCITPW
jgi:hypothetical protein